MAVSRAATLYKTLKQNGILALPKDGKSITWTPDQPPNASPSLNIAIQNVSNLQKTPETAKKAMLKIFAKGSEDAEAVDHTFTFTSAEARTEIEAITERIRKLIDDYKKEQLAVAGASGGQSAAMTIANAISGGRGAGQIWEDDDRLKSDIKLQHALMQQDPQLHKTFVEALSVKPDSISSLQFTQQFWASRVHLLRAYALAQHQDRGRSNVFSEIGTAVAGKVNITSEQIHIIFEQHPLVRRVYDELVPKTYSETSFWRRFFQSQLYLRLRGMKTDDRRDVKDENIDSDQYLNAPELTGLRPTAPELHIPKFLDLEGNEENHSRRQGNKPDNENNQANLEKAPVIRKLNALSEKLMAAVRPLDVDVSAPIGTMEAEYEQLSLRDLQDDPEQQRITLNIRDQSRFFTDKKQSEQSDLNPFRKLNPSKAISSVYNDLTTAFPQPGSNTPLPIPPFTEIDPSTDDSTDQHSSGALHAHNHIMDLIQSHRSLTATIPPHSTLPPTIYERATLTHATSIEFLRQFWSAFLSGDASRASEVAALVDSLIRATERIGAIATEADELRASRIKALEQEAREKARLTGSKPKRVNAAALESGGDVVRELMRPILESLGKAEQAYRKAYAEQMTEQGGEEVGTPQPA